MCICEACTSTEVKTKYAKLENKPLEVKIGHPTPEVIIQIMSCEKAIIKINTIFVKP